MMSAFGLTVELALHVPELEPLPVIGEEQLPPGPALHVELADDRLLDAAWSGPAPSTAPARAFVDGSVWSIQRGQAGDVRMDHAQCRFHLDPPGTTLLCAPSDESDPGWRRLMLDTALVSASLTRGFDALHAGCVVSKGGAVAIAGASGAGKTTLMLELLRAGASFLTDDVLTLVPDGSAVLGQPGPPVANLPADQDVDGVAERLHPFGDEWWGRIRNPHSAPAPVNTVVVVERAERGRDDPVITPVSAPVPSLLALALDSGRTAERKERRLEVLARLAQCVEVIAVTVSGAIPPGELVQRLIQAVPLLQA